jgi:hypothetical protein
MEETTSSFQPSYGCLPTWDHHGLGRDRGISLGGEDRAGNS